MILFFKWHLNIGILFFGVKTLDFAIHCCGPCYIMYLSMYEHTKSVYKF